MNDFKTFVEAIADATIHHLPVLLPLSFILVKLVLIRMSGHKEDQWRAILGVPEDVAYGALALIIAGLSGDIKAFETYFNTSQHPQADIWILFGMGIGICYSIHLIHQHLVLSQFEGWKAADELIAEHEREHPGTQSGAVRGYTVVYFVKFSTFIFFLIIEASLSIWWIDHIAQIIETK